MRIWGCAVAVLLLASTAVPASALNWSVGANLGVAFDMPADKYTGVENTTTFAWPFSGTMPGLRFGFTGESPTHEVYLDTGLSYSSTKDAETFRSFIGTANYQYNFGSSNLSPYVTAGGGFLVVGYKDETDPDAVLDISATSAVFGGGVGIRHKMGNGNGTMRAEVRFDRVSEGEDTVEGVTFPLILEGNVFTIKFGFDLWDTK